MKIESKRAKEKSKRVVDQKRRGVNKWNKKRREEYQRGRRVEEERRRRDQNLKGRRIKLYMSRPLD